MAVSAGKSVTSATGASQTLADANPSRKELYINNISATTWYICLTGGTASNGGVDCIPLAAAGEFKTTIKNKITAIGTAAAKLTVVES